MHWIVFARQLSAFGCFYSRVEGRNSMPRVATFGCDWNLPGMSFRWFCDFVSSSEGFSMVLGILKCFSCFPNQMVVFGYKGKV